MQCLEILSRSYGFNSYNGLKASKEENPLQQFNIETFKVQINYFFLQENPLSELDLLTSSDILQNGIYSKVNTEHIFHCFEFIKKNNFISELKPLKVDTLDYWFDDYFTFDHSLNFSYKESIFGNNNNRIESISTTCAEFLMGYIIENIKSFEVINQSGMATLTIPLNIFYKHAINNDINLAKSHIDTLINIFNLAGLVISKGNLDYIKNDNSSVNLTISTTVYKQLLTANGINTELTKALKPLYAMMLENEIIERIKNPTSADRLKMRLFKFIFLSQLNISNVGQPGRIVISTNLPKASQYLEIHLQTFNDSLKISKAIESIKVNLEPILNFLKFQSDQISILESYTQYLKDDSNPIRSFDSKFKAQEALYLQNLKDLVLQINNDFIQRI